MNVTLYDRTAEHVITYFQKTNNAQIDAIQPAPFGKMRLFVIGRR